MIAKKDTNLRFWLFALSLTYALSGVCFLACQAPKQDADYTLREPIPTTSGLDVAITITEERFPGPPEMVEEGVEIPRVVRDWNAPEMLKYEVAIGPGDVINIIIYYGIEKELMNLHVKGDGSIVLPLVGRLYITGKTPTELEDILQEQFQHFFVSPTVSVRVSEFRSHRIYVVGLGVAGREIPMVKRTTLFEVILQLGGALTNVDLRGAYLQRGDRIYPLDLKRILEGDLSFNYELEDNDIIYLRSMKTQHFFIMGEVSRSGEQKLMVDDNLFWALARANPTKRAQLHDIRIIRGGLNNPILIRVDIKVLYKRKPPRIFTTEDFQRLHISVEASRHSSLSLDKLYLQNEDLIFVPRTVLAHWNDVLQEVSPMIRFILTQPLTLARDTVLLERAFFP